MDVDLSPKYISRLSHLQGHWGTAIKDISDVRNGLLMEKVSHDRFDNQDFAFLPVCLFLAPLTALLKI